MHQASLRLRPFGQVVARRASEKKGARKCSEGQATTGTQFLLAKVVDSQRSSKTKPDIPPSQLTSSGQSGCVTREEEQTVEIQNPRGEI